MKDLNIKKLEEHIKSLKIDASIDSHFAVELKERLMKAATHTPAVSPYFPFFTKSFSTVKDLSGRYSARISSGAVGALIALLIAVPVTYEATRQSIASFLSSQISVKDMSNGLSLKQQISNKGINAFGSLALLPLNTTVATSSSAVADENIQSSTSAATTSAVVAAVSSQNTPSYEYVGNPNLVLGNTGIVYERNSGITISVTPADDAGAISTTSTSTDISAATSSIAAQPSLAALAALATQFFQIHSIDTSSYGAPVLVSMTATTSQPSAELLYSLELSGQDVYDQSGDRYGLIVSIDTDLMKVVGVQNLTVQTYESSEYSLDADPVSVLNKIPNLINTASSTAAIPLTTPQQILLRYMIKQSDGSNNELYVPALLFTSTSSPSTRVIVPLLKNTLPGA